jgi:hypothetical protein
MPNFQEKATFANCIALDISQFQIKVEIGRVRCWIPLSQIDDTSEVYENGQEGTLVVSAWIAKEKGLL